MLFAGCIFCVSSVIVRLCLLSRGCYYYRVKSAKDKDAKGEPVIINQVCEYKSYYCTFQRL